MTSEATRDAHRAVSGPARSWDHAAYGRWLAGVEQGRERPRSSHRPAVVSIVLVGSTLVVAYLVGAVTFYVQVVLHLVDQVTP